MTTDLTPTELARALAARRQTVTGACAVCGTPFVGLRRRKYCSERCKQAAKNARATPTAPTGSRERRQRVG